MKDLDPCGWDKGQQVTVGWENADTLVKRNIYLLLRVNDTFGMDSLRLTVSGVSPDSTCYNEEFTVFIPGKPRKINNHFELTFPYRENVVLDRVGRYSFAIGHNMESPIKGVEAAGFLF